MDDGADSVACGRSDRPTAISTKPLHTQLTPSSAIEHVENAGTRKRRQPLRTESPTLNSFKKHYRHFADVSVALEIDRY